MINPVAYVRTSVSELSKVTWPSRATIIRHSLLVAISIGVATLVVGLIDTGLTYLVRFIVER